MKYALLISIIVLFNACSVTVDSMIDKSNANKPYRNILIVLPVEKSSLRDFTGQLKQNMENNFKADNKKVEIIYHELSTSSNSKDIFRDIKKSYNTLINDDRKDLVVVFQPLNQNNSESVGDKEGNRKGFRSFKIVATDTKTNTDPWIASINSSNVISKKSFAKKSADLLFQKLKTDGII